MSETESGPTVNGVVHTTYERPEIGYHGVAASVPSHLVATPRLGEGGFLFGELGTFHPAQFVQAAPQGAISLTYDPGDDGAEAGVSPSDLPQERGAVAVLDDGLPLVDHRALRGRVEVLDVFEVSATYPTQDRVHGTQVASCIAHGDLSAGSAPLGERVLAVPMLMPGADGGEVIPPHQLVVQRLCQAVEAMMTMDDERIRIVNLSLGDSDTPFQRTPSAWARAVDWLSYRHNLLFIVSAGNHPQIDQASIRDSQMGLFGANANAIKVDLVDAQTERRLLAPAEAVNAVTVGALDEDSGPSELMGRQVMVDLGVDRISPISPFGGGVGRSVKPDVLFPGGRQTFTEPADNHRPLNAARSPLPPGIKVASPTNASPTNGAIFQAGTSFACAMATRRASQTLSALREAVNVPREFELALVKALLVHGAALPQHNQGLETMFGYGPVDLDLSEGANRTA